jgi:hypothetical protein
MAPPQKIIIFRSIAGFGDRLQMLGGIFQYCMKNKAKLCVDWFDYVFSGYKHDFYDFFDILGIETISKKEVLEYIRKKKNKLQIVPPCWNYDTLSLPIRKEDFIVEKDFMSIPTEDYALPEGDIFVFNGAIDFTYKPVHLSTHFRIKPHIVKIIKDKLRDFDFSGTVIHLRGTDNMLVNEEDLRRTFKDTKESVYVVTDDLLLYNKILAVLPQLKLVNPTSHMLKIKTTHYRDNSIIGSHMIEPEVLNQYSIRKYDMIIDLLVDWTALLYSKKIFGNKKSCFFKSAGFIKQGPVEEYSKIYNGWIPTTYSIAPTPSLNQIQDSTASTV